MKTQVSKQGACKSEEFLHDAFQLLKTLRIVTVQVVLVVLFLEYQLVNQSASIYWAFAQHVGHAHQICKWPKSWRMVNTLGDRHSVQKDFDSLEQWAESNKMKWHMG